MRALAKSGVAVPAIRALGLLRPLLLIALLRALDRDAAGAYVQGLSLYLLMLEGFNVIAPTDALYLPGATPGQVHATQRRRARAALAYLPLAGLAAVWIAKLPALDVALVALSALLGAWCTARTSFLFARAQPQRLLRSEALSWGWTMLALAAWGAGASGFAVALAVSLETVLRAFVLGRLPPLQPAAAAEHGTSPDVAPDRVAEGLTLTLANYVFRVPFAFPGPGGALDPALVVAAQLPSTFYNLLLVTHSARVRRWCGRAAMVLVVAALAAAVAVVLADLAPGLQLAAELAVGCALAPAYALFLYRLPGAFGLARRPRERLLLVAALACAAMLAWGIDARLILGAHMLALLVLATYDLPSDAT